MDGEIKEFINNDGKNGHTLMRVFLCCHHPKQLRKKCERDYKIGKLAFVMHRVVFVS